MRNVLATLLLLVAFSAFGYAIGAVIAEMLPTEAQSSPVDLNANKQLQIANYVDGTALLLNVHITHHAGTSVCHLMKKLGPAPGFACMRPGIKERTNQEWPEGMPTPQPGHRKGGCADCTQGGVGRICWICHADADGGGRRVRASAASGRSRLPGVLELPLLLCWIRDIE